MKYLIIILKLQIHYVLILGTRLCVNNSIQYSIHLNPDKLVKKRLSEKCLTALE